MLSFHHSAPVLLSRNQAVASQLWLGRVVFICWIIQRAFGARFPGGFRAADHSEKFAHGHERRTLPITPWPMISLRVAVPPAACAPGVRRSRARSSSQSRVTFTAKLRAQLFCLAAIMALLWANSPWAASYFALRDAVLTFQLGPFRFSEDLVHWINDGLMTLFFFIVSLEIKRELVRGELSTPKKAALPVAAALGGMLVPVAIFLLFNWGQPGRRLGHPNGDRYCLRPRRARSAREKDSLRAPRFPARLCDRR